MGLFTRSAGKPTRGEKKAARKAARAARRETERADAEAIRAANAAAAAARRETKQAKKDTREALKEAKAAPGAAKAAAKAEEKAIEADTKARKKAFKAEEKAVKKDGRAVRKAAKKVGSSGSLAAASALVVAETNSRGPMTFARARRLVNVGQVLLPVLAPYALSAVNTARAQWDTRRAARLGIATDQLGAFSGPGGALHARLSHVADALTKLESLPEAKPGTSAHSFAATTRARIADLSVAVRAAEQMPTARRRAVYRAIGTELDTIESTLLGHLGVTA